MKKIVFATNNLNKLRELRSAVKDFDIIGLKDLNIFEDIPETGNTLKNNALQKARYIYEKTGLNCFADDTGLEIEALNNNPGVYSARYAGDKCSSEDNIQKVLFELTNSTNRNAVFKTVMALIIDGKKYFFEGHIKGMILKKKSGIDGFGYDPIFRPNGFNDSFAEMSIERKNEISHRGIAVRKLIDFLKNY
ncbi:MAG: non-canonical purine NTP pyrophosphatase [Crocinitomicaceae bacterium]|nr:non-canonical purine NTP pyrophosphatase [Crocinitomicaceae bacterium]